MGLNFLIATISFVFLFSLPVNLLSASGEGNSSIVRHLKQKYKDFIRHESMRIEREENRAKQAVTMREVRLKQQVALEKARLVQSKIKRVVVIPEETPEYRQYLKEDELRKLKYQQDQKAYASAKGALKKNLEKYWNIEDLESLNIYEAERRSE